MKAIKRVNKELEQLRKEDINGITIAEHNGPASNIYHWDVTLDGPKDTPYEGGIFKLSVDIPEDYPFKPPKILFITQIYHPNISTEGKICLSVLSNSWSPAVTIILALKSIITLLQDIINNTIEYDNVINSEATEVYNRDKNLFMSNAAECTKKYAI